MEMNEGILTNENTQETGKIMKKREKMVQRLKYWAVTLFSALPQTAVLTFSKQVCQ